MSASFPHLSKAPIAEAIIDFRVRLAADFDVARIKELHLQFQDRYPGIEDQKLVEHRFEPALAKGFSPRTVDHGTVGYLFRSADEASIAQFRRDGFTFNRLQPYTSWEQVFPEAIRLWRIYVETFQPLEIHRIAIRYINRLLLPELQDYLTVPPVVPNQMPAVISGFVSRVVINDPDSNITTAVVQALEGPAQDRYLPVILDIDVFDQNVSHLRADELLARFEKLREMKNRAFFGSITGKTVGMLK